MVNQCALSKVVTRALCIEEKEVMFVVTPCCFFPAADNVLTSPLVTDTGVMML